MSRFPGDGFKATEFCFRNPGLRMRACTVRDGFAVLCARALKSQLAQINQLRHSFSACGVKHTDTESK